MFDPTIFENLKVIVEGELYDLDLRGEISIIDRNDIVNLATMSRCFSIIFQLLGASPLYSAIIKLEAGGEDLYSEILEMDEQHGCRLFLYIKYPINDLTDTPSLIQDELALLWENRPIIEQEISFFWTKDTSKRNYYSQITLQFDRKINESHISDFPQLIELLLKSLQLVENLND